jgi:hypothetical protein
VSEINPAVFGFIDDYVKAIRFDKRLLAKLGKDDSLIKFCREFFQQFLAREFGVQVTRFSAKEALDVWLRVQPNLEERDRRASIVGAFRQFSLDYDTLIAERYDRGGDLTSFQDELVPELLDAIAEWADDDDVGVAAKAALKKLDAAIGALEEPAP